MFRRLFIFTTMMFSSLNANSFIDCMGGLDLNGEFLWWKAQNENYYVNQSVSDSHSAVTRTITPYTFGYDPGFRVGLDYNFNTCENGYYLYGNYSYFRSTRSLSLPFTLTSAGSYVIIGVLQNNPSISVVGASIDYTGNGNLLYNRVDLGLMKMSYRCCGLSIAPKIAFTYAYISQNLREFYVSSNPTATAVSNIAITAKSKFPGYGATLGFDTNYGLPWGLSFVSSLGISPLWGRWELDRTQSITLTVPPPPVVSSSFAESEALWVGRWIFQVQLGLQYAQYFCNDSMHIAARVGWEFQTLSNMVNFNRISFTDPSSLEINGLIAGLEFGF